MFGIEVVAATRKKPDGDRADRVQRLVCVAVASGVPVHAARAIVAYWLEHRRTGDFLRCVLENDLTGATGRADEINLPALKAIVSFVYMTLPPDSWGDRKSVEQWLKQGCPGKGGQP